MPKNLQKSIHVYLSKLKKPNPNLQSSPKLINSSTNWILSGCKHPKTLSFAIEKTDTNNREDDAATLSDIDRFLFENFNSLYRNESENDDDKKKKKKNEDHEDGFLFESPRLVDPPPANIRASNRFFVSPGTSSSLVEEARSSAGSTFDEIGSSSSTPTLTPSESISVETESTKGLILPEDSIAVLRNSPNPYEDFQRSMHDMIEARLNQNQSVDWDFMEELLFCYLKLNEKKSHKYILGAFVDLIVSLRQNSSKSQAKWRKIPSKGERRRRK
ncbi:Ovate protein family [Macleaya cordata]|uniref:Transcription repressor n=1 Tax=Macleaya cordata TaxID=56857 RepID=A0A200PNZ9_MACCD|nr:Ovate protein family [Macleaya cordata]